MKIKDVDKTYSQFKKEILETNQVDEAIPLPSMTSVGSAIAKGVGNIAKSAVAKGVGNVATNVATNVSGLANKALQKGQQLGRSASAIQQAYQQGYKSGYRGGFSSNDSDDLEQLLRKTPPSNPQQAVLKKLIRQEPININDKNMLGQIKNNIRRGQTNLNPNKYVSYMDTFQKGEMPDMSLDDFEALYTALGSD